MSTRREPLAWRSDDFYDEEQLDTELRRVFDICHGCRLCFNLCNSFPALFDLVDDAPSGELDTVPSADFNAVVDNCTLCDLCVPKCPYTPPHELALDFPAVVMRHRIAANRAANEAPSQTPGIPPPSSPPPPAADHGQSFGGVGAMDQAPGRFRAHVADGVSRDLGLRPACGMALQLAQIDRNAALATALPAAANLATAPGSPLRGPLGLHPDAALPSWTADTAGKSVASAGGVPPEEADVVVYTTCMPEYSHPDVARAAVEVLARAGVSAALVYPECCGMPLLEQGRALDVAEKAVRVAEALAPHVARGATVAALTPSCALMLKTDWPMLLPEHEGVLRLAEATQDICELVVGRGGLSQEGLGELPAPVVLHVACHAKVQNVGNKALEMLRQVPGAQVTVVDKCSGHGGSWGCTSEHHETALKVGKAAGRGVARAAGDGPVCLASECPLAGPHVMQVMDGLGLDVEVQGGQAVHPIELVWRAYLSSS